MKQLYRVIALMLSVSLLLSCITGCSKKAKKIANKPKKDNSISSEENTGNDSETDNFDFEDSDDTDFPDFSDDFGSFVDTRTLTFNTSTATYSGFGGFSALYSGYDFHSDAQTSYTDEELEWEIQRVIESGITMVRANFYVSWAWDYTNNCYDYNSDDMKAFYRYAARLKENDIDIAIVLNDTVYDSFDSRKTPFTIITGNQNDDDCSREAGKFISDFVKTVIIGKGYSNIKYVEMFTEPGNDFFDTIYTVTDRKAQFDINLKYFKAIHQQLSADGLRNRIQIVGPNVAIHHLVEPYLTYGLDWLKWTVAEANEFIDIYSIHTYSRASYTDDDYQDWTDFIGYVKDIILPTGKKLLVDEFGYGYDDGISVTSYDSKFYNPLTSIHIMNAYVAMMNSGFVSGATLWSLADEKWPYSIRNSKEFEEGIQLSGYCIPNIKKSVKLKPAYYLMSVFGKAVKKNCDTFAGTSVESGVYSTLVKNTDGSMAIIVVNIGLTNVDVNYNFSQSLGNKTFYKYVFNQEVKSSKYVRPLGLEDTIRGIKSTFNDSIEAYSIVIYTTEKQ